MISAVLVPLAGRAFAQEAGTSPAAPAPSDPDQIVCKELPPETGTRIGGRRVCHKQREWDAIRQRAADELEKRQIQRGISGGG